MGFLIGIDCGASGTDVLLYFRHENDGANKKSTNYKFPAINFNLLGLENTVKHLSSAVKKSAGNLKNTDYIVAGISGARNPKDRQKIRKKLQKSLNFKNIEIHPDTEIALIGAFGFDEKNCGIMIAGTGSVLYYRDSRGKIIRIGGWGRHIGDEGSGFWIARNALHKITQSYDGRSQKTSLSGKLNKKLKINSNNIVQHIYHNNFEISTITKLVFECAEAGDKICRQVITEAAENLSKHFIPVKNKKMRIALCGALFSKEKLLGKYLKKIMKQNYPGIKLVEPEFSPVWGAIKLGMKNKR